MACGRLVDVLRSRKDADIEFAAKCRKVRFTGDEKYRGLLFMSLLGQGSQSKPGQVMAILCILRFLIFILSILPVRFITTTTIIIIIIIISVSRYIGGAGHFSIRSISGLSVQLAFMCYEVHVNPGCIPYQSYFCFCSICHPLLVGH